MMKKDLVALFAIIYGILAADAQHITQSIDALVEKTVSINRVNGAVLVSIHGKIVYEGLSMKKEETTKK